MELLVDTEIVISGGIREVISEDGAVLLDIEQGICFTLNPVGLKIWQLLKQGKSVDAVVDALANEFEIPRHQLGSRYGGIRRRSRSEMLDFSRREDSA